MSELARIQRWFQDQIVGPHEGGVKPGKSPREMILPSRSLKPAERMSTYSRMYFARLHEVLCNDYPAVLTLVGEDTMWRLARGFLAKHPSRSHTLETLGRKFPKFLERASRVPKRALVVDVARVENAMDEIFHRPIVEPVRPKTFDPENARFEFVPAYQLIKVRGPVNEIVSAAKQGRPVPTLHRQTTWIAVHRTEKYELNRWDLDEPRFVMLRALQRGRPLGKAAEAAFRVWPGSDEAFEKAIFAWFQEWTGEGFFARIGS